MLVIINTDLLFWCESAWKFHMTWCLFFSSTNMQQSFWLVATKNVQQTTEVEHTEITLLLSNNVELWLKKIKRKKKAEHPATRNIVNITNNSNDFSKEAHELPKRKHTPLRKKKKLNSPKTPRAPSVICNFLSHQVFFFIQAGPEENNIVEGSSQAKWYIWAFRLEYRILRNSWVDWVSLKFSPGWLMWVSFERYQITFLQFSLQESLSKLVESENLKNKNEQGCLWKVNRNSK